MKRNAGPPEGRDTDGGGTDAEIAGVRLTHPDKVMYAGMGLTKRDVAAFVEAVGDRLLADVAGRPVSLVRCPDGRHKACFFQRHGFAGLPDDVDTIDLGGRMGEALVVRSVRGLVGLVQIGTLEFHAWGAHVDDLERPDRLVLDLDPDPALPFERVKRAAREVRERLTAAGLASFLKVTGGKGLHVVVPLNRRHGWDEVKAFGRALARCMEAEAPADYVATMSKAKRAGRIFIDYFRNDRGNTAVAAWSPRARAGAPVAVPVPWEALDTLPGANAFTVDLWLGKGSAPTWNGRDTDPWRDMDRVSQSLTARARRTVGLQA